jgi:hypothetical protein
VAVHDDVDELGTIVWLEPGHFTTIYARRREHLAERGVDVAGLDAALAAVAAERPRVGVTATVLDGVRWALFITESRVLGSLRLPQ